MHLTFIMFVIMSFHFVLELIGSCSVHHSPCRYKNPLWVFLARGHVEWLIRKRNEKGRETTKLEIQWRFLLASQACPIHSTCFMVKNRMRYKELWNDLLHRVWHTYKNWCETLGHFNDQKKCWSQLEIPSSTAGIITKAKRFLGVLQKCLCLGCWIFHNLWAA